MKPEGVEKLIVLAAGFYASGGTVVTVRDRDIDRYRSLAAGRASDVRPPGSHVSSLLDGFGRIGSALTLTDRPSTRRMVALDSDRRIIGAMSYYPSEGGIYVSFLGSSGEVRGTGTALLASLTMAADKSFIKVNAYEKRWSYFAEIGFTAINDRGDMRLSRANMGYVRRATPELMGL